MPKELPDYEASFLEQLRKNRDLVKEQLAKREKGLIRKIHTYCKRFGYTAARVEDKIQSDELFASCFTKDPAKQNIFEKLAGEYIESIELISDYKTLPTDKKNAKYVIDGNVTEKKGGTSKAKSIDFQWTCADKNFYASHKYIREGGGAQDNQYPEIKTFIEQANYSEKETSFFFAITDGNYFDTKDGNRTKIEKLKTLANNQRGVYALPLSELHEVLKYICGYS